MGARQKIDDVSGAIGEVSQVIRGVSEAAHRQSQEIDQLAKTIQALDRLTQDNAGMVGTWSHSAGELRGESQRLAALVTRFKLPAQDAVTTERPVSELNLSGVSPLPLQAATPNRRRLR